MNYIEWALLVALLNTSAKCRDYIEKVNIAGMSSLENPPLQTVNDAQVEGGAHLEAVHGNPIVLE
jgi:hypothetical protein